MPASPVRFQSSSTFDIHHSLFCLFHRPYGTEVPGSFHHDFRDGRTFFGSRRHRRRFTLMRIMGNIARRGNGYSGCRLQAARFGLSTCLLQPGPASGIDNIHDRIRSCVKSLHEKQATNASTSALAQHSRGTAVARGSNNLDYVSASLQSLPQ
jgi:hypothetical protein